MPRKLPPNFVYDAFLWVLAVIVGLFFREIHPRSTWKVSHNGPMILVAAPHANQFVDSVIIMRILRQDVRRRISWLIAEKSMKRMFIGFGARIMGSVPVGRALDSKKPGMGKILLPDPEGDPTLVRGVGTDFEDKECQVGGLLVLPSVNGDSARAEIKEIINKTEIRLKKAFRGSAAYKQLTGRETQDSAAGLGNNYGGTSFSLAPHVDQAPVYHAVFKNLRNGGCIGIFPEGGSHDRTELLPLKAGVAIMALGTLAENPDCGLKVVPCGLNYFHAHKFRSRAVIEFGTPVEIPRELVEKYRNGEKGEAISQVLDLIYGALVTVTVQAPDYETLMLIQAVRRLYNPKGKPLPLGIVVELNRRLVKGYQRFREDERVVDLKKSILDYNKTLMMLNIRDHQVSYAKFPYWKVILALFYRVGKLVVLAVAALPGVILFGPVFVAGKQISLRKSREALAASSVKVKARDVMATWKILVAMAFAPFMYTVWVIIFCTWHHHNRIGGVMPKWVSLKMIFFGGYVVFPAITWASLRFGEIGMDIFKSLRPLFLSLDPRTGNTMVRLRERRENLVKQVTDVINELGPEVYPDFDHFRIIADPNHPLSPLNSRPTTPRERSRPRGEDGLLRMTPDSSTYPATAMGSGGGGSGGLSLQRLHTHETIHKNESFMNLSSVAIFATRPGTPTSSHFRSRANSGSSSAGISSSSGGGGGGFMGHHVTGSADGLKPMTSITNNSSGSNKKGVPTATNVTTTQAEAEAEELRRKIKSAMRERGRRRASEAEGGGGEDEGDDEGVEEGEAVSIDFGSRMAKKDI